MYVLQEIINNYNPANLSIFKMHFVFHFNIADRMLISSFTMIKPDLVKYFLLITNLLNIRVGNF